MGSSTCPCCGYKTFDAYDRGNYIICPVCFWEDDPVQTKDPDFGGGANSISLKEAQRNFIAFGASRIDMIKNVRKPKDDEPLDADWKLAE